jgi:hypothetical protein
VDVMPGAGVRTDRWAYHINGFVRAGSSDCGRRRVRGWSARSCPCDSSRQTFRADEWVGGDVTNSPGNGDPTQPDPSLTRRTPPSDEPETRRRPVSLAKGRDAATQRLAAAAGDGPAAPGDASKPPAGWAGWTAPPVPGRSANSPGAGDPSRARRLALPIAGVVLAAVVVAVLLGRTSTDHGSSTLSGAGPTSYVSVGSASASGPSLTPSEPSTAAPVPTVSTPAPPPSRSPGGIDLSRVRYASQVRQVAKMLDTYFTGVNNHDARLATSVFDPRGVINPHDPDQVRRFGEGTSTSTDDRLVIDSIRPSAPGHLAVSVRFRSRQDPRYGPHGERCTMWELQYDLVKHGSVYRILTSHGANKSC